MSNTKAANKADPYAKADVTKLLDDLHVLAPDYGVQIDNSRDNGWSVDVSDKAAPIIIVACQPEIADRGQSRIMRSADEVRDLIQTARGEGAKKYEKEAPAAEAAEA